MNVHVYFDSHEIERLRGLITPELFNKARMGALKRVASNMRKNIRKYMRAASYLSGRDITQAIGRLVAHSGGEEYSIKIAGTSRAAHRFKMQPNRITARKGQRSRNWAAPAVAIGPGEAIRQPLRAGFSKPFIARTASGLKAMYLREKMSGRLEMPKIVSPQYFAAFDRVKEPVLNEAEATFLKRLEHEIDYRLGLAR